MNFTFWLGLHWRGNHHGRTRAVQFECASSGEWHGRPQKPSEWLRHNQTKELIAEFETQSPNFDLEENQPLSVKRGGNNAGTFAVEELAVAYAAWIRPAFCLKMNQTLIDYRTDPATAMVAPSHMEFAFEGHQLRTLLIDGEPWFVGKDVAEALGYADAAQAIRAHCKKAVTLSQHIEGGQIHHPKENNNLQGVRSTFGVDPQTKLIPESDVYRLIVKSGKPEAERLEEKIMEEILPTIRKTGSYGAPAQLFSQVSLFLKSFGQKIPDSLRDVWDCILIPPESIESVQHFLVKSDEFLDRVLGWSRHDYPHFAYVKYTH